MNVEWLHHTGFNVSDMERSLEFYRDLLGLEVTNDLVVEGEIFEQLTAQKNPRAHIVFLGSGDSRHMLKLIQWLSHIGELTNLPATNGVWLSHLGLRIDNVDGFYNSLSARVVRFINPSAVREGAV